MATLTLSDAQKDTLYAIHMLSPGKSRPWLSRLEIGEYRIPKGARTHVRSNIHSWTMDHLVFLKKEYLIEVRPNREQWRLTAFGKKVARNLFEEE